MTKKPTLIVCTVRSRPKAQKAICLERGSDRFLVIDDPADDIAEIISVLTESSGPFSHEFQEVQ